MSQFLAADPSSSSGDQDDMLFFVRGAADGKARPRRPPRGWL